MRKVVRLFKASLLSLISATVVLLGLRWPQAIRRDSPESAYVVRCASNLREIGVAISLHCENNNGRAPDSMAAVMALPNLPPAIFQCPSEAANRHFTLWALLNWEDPPPISAYTYIAGGRISGVDREHIVLMFEPSKHHQQLGGNVLFADTHTEFVSAAEIIRMQNQLTAGIRPVGPPTTAHATK